MRNLPFLRKSVLPTELSTCPAKPWFRKRKRAGRRHARQRFLRCEQLEARRVLATITVAALDTASLTTAINTANGNGQADDIVHQGAVAHEQVPGLMQAADVLVAPYTHAAPGGWACRSVGWSLGRPSSR